MSNCNYYYKKTNLFCQKFIGLNKCCGFCRDHCQCLADYEYMDDSLIDESDLDLLIDDSNDQPSNISECNMEETESHDSDMNIKPNLILKNNKKKIFLIDSNNSTLNKKRKISHVINPNNEKDILTSNSQQNEVINQINMDTSPLNAPDIILTYLKKLNLIN